MEPVPSDSPSSGDFTSWFGGITQGLGNVVNAITGSINAVIRFLNPMSDTFFLKVALIPSDDYFTTYFDDIKTAFDAKIPLVGQLMEFGTNITTQTFNAEPPNFQIELPGKWGAGTSVSIIDFTMFDQYRAFILNFIRCIAWYFFIKRLLRRLPQTIYN